MCTTITTRYHGDGLFESTIGKHRWQHSAADGGSPRERTPSPLQLLVLSLGSCIAALAVHLCERRQLSPEGLSVDVSYDEADSPAELTNIRVTTRLPPDWPDDAGLREVIAQAARYFPIRDAFTQPEIGFELAH